MADQWFYDGTGYVSCLLGPLYTGNLTGSGAGGVDGANFNAVWTISATQRGPCAFVWQNAGLPLWTISIVNVSPGQWQAAAFPAASPYKYFLAFTFNQQLGWSGQSWVLPNVGDPDYTGSLEIALA